MEILKKVTKEEFKEFLYKINIDDKNLYEEVNNSTFNIFQLSGGTASKFVKELKPESFEECNLLSAVSRPGSSSFLAPYIAYDKNPAFPEAANELLKETHGQPIYQEQVMKVFNVIGGFSLEETNEIRSLMKKLGKANKKPEDLKKWDEAIKKFIEGCQKKGVTPSEAKKMAAEIMKMSGYSFCKAHSSAYTYTSIICLYLAHYFRAEFYSASLNYESEKTEGLEEAIESAKENGFQILPPDINKSNTGFRPEGKAIRFGLSNIKGVTSKSIDSIIENRPYNSIIDFIVKNLIETNKRITIALIGSGSFDSLIVNERVRYKKIAETFYERKKTCKVKELLEKKWEELEAEIPYLSTNNEDLIEMDLEFLKGNYFHSIFTDAINLKFRGKFTFKSLKELQSSNLKEGVIPVYVETWRTHEQKNGQEMLFANVIDCVGTKARIPIFGSYWSFVKEKFDKEGFYLMMLFVNDKEEIMFGRKKWSDDKIKAKFLKKIV
jgi:DNA polymerase-3 subunit alpha